MIRLLFGLVIFCIAGVLILLSLAFLIVSFYFYLQTFFSSVVAALLCGIFFLVIAVFLLLLVKAGSKPTKVRIAATKAKIQSNILDVSSFLKKYFGESMVVIAALGFLVGFSKEIRETFFTGINVVMRKFLGLDSEDNNRSARDSKRDDL